MCLEPLFWFAIEITLFGQNMLTVLITAQILAGSLANFYRQKADRHMSL